MTNKGPPLEKLDLYSPFQTPEPPPDEDHVDLRIGVRIRTSLKSKTPNGDWTVIAHKDRKWNVTGSIIYFEGSRGPCYRVLYDEGSYGWFGPSELTVV